MVFTMKTISSDLQIFSSRPTSGQTAFVEFYGSILRLVPLGLGRAQSGGVLESRYARVGILSSWVLFYCSF
jgi:hypothetical protein